MTNYLYYTNISITIYIIIMIKTILKVRFYAFTKLMFILQSCVPSPSYTANH